MKRESFSFDWSAARQGASLTSTLNRHTAYNSTDLFHGMIYLLLQECPRVFPVISFLLIYSLQGLRRTMSTATSAWDSSPSAPAFSPCSSPFSWSTTARCFELPSSDTENAEMGAMKRAKIEPAAAGSFYRQEIRVVDSPATRRAASLNMKKRPARLVLPEQQPSMAEFSEMGRGKAGKEEESMFQARGRDYCLASKRGRRDIMEDGYGVTLDISGDPKQAFFAVIDGHGGRAAADYVSENLGKNILRAIESATKTEGADSCDIEQAIRGGYSVTDEEFLRKGVTGGACAAGVLVKGGFLHVSNVGDCRVVLSRNGVADTLTSDHRPSRDDERLRIESSGGLVHFRNGVWRVQGSLAISRAIGDIHLKEWIICEPEIRKLPIISDCEFLILASDGLWDKVTSQEAVDVISQEKNLQDSCRKLIDTSSCRGNMDDVTVMVIDLRSFV